MACYRAVTSKKPARAGEVFILRNDKFILKIYRDAAPDVMEFADWLVYNLQTCEDKRDERRAEEAAP